jgi:hypothetical protein
MQPLSLPSGTTYCTMPDGSRQCTGSQMGRRNILPDDCQQPYRLRLERLRWVDGDYWGNSGGTAIYCAHGDTGDIRALVFARARNREHAKELVRESLPLAKFYR